MQVENVVCKVKLLMFFSQILLTEIYFAKIHLYAPATFNIGTDLLN